MPDPRFRDDWMSYLSNRFERARVILFTGAGFSSGARNVNGDLIPSTRDLRQQLWRLSFGDDSLDDAATLPSLFETACRRHKQALTCLLQDTFRVESQTIPSYYETYFSMPWSRIYTLNIDDLADATSRRFKLPRTIRALSAIPTRLTPTRADEPGGLAVIHLNGTLADDPDDLSFSMPQYASRVGRPDPAYAELASELLSFAFVFVGTQLDEPPLWQHIEERRSRGGRGQRELRPRSFLVTPHLDRARQYVLQDYNVEWVEMTAADFECKVLANLSEAAARGLALIRDSSTSDSSSMSMQDVASAAVNPNEPSEYLLGQEPVWADIQSGRAIGRDCDDELWSIFEVLRARADARGALLITGTAGSGKSTALMRLALRIASDTDLRVGWIDRHSEMSPSQILDRMRRDDAPGVVALDDADLYSYHLFPMLRDIIDLPWRPLALLAMRSARVDALLTPSSVKGLLLREVTMPHLTNADIGRLLDVLDTENRLGQLKGLNRTMQEAAFREKAGRQLLVAMIEATCGRKLEERVVDEYEQLPPDGQLAYAIISTATHFRFSLGRDEILLATGNNSNSMLNVIDGLVKRKLVVEVARTGRIEARHRRLSEILVDALVQKGEFHEVVRGIAWLAATKVRQGMRRSERPSRMLRAVINHEFLARVVGAGKARAVYDSIEEALNWEPHFWLQRGSLEVEVGNLPEAENFLGQARSLNPDDPFIRNEWAYLLLRKAVERPGTPDAATLAGEGIDELFDLISRHADINPYPYHVLGSQGIAWARRGIASPERRRDFLLTIKDALEDGCRRHPKHQWLQKLYEDVKREWLMTTVDGHCPL